MNFPRVLDLFELRGKSLSRRGFYKNTNCEEHVFYFGPFDRDSTEYISRAWSTLIGDAYTSADTFAPSIKHTIGIRFY